MITFLAELRAKLQDAATKELGVLTKLKEDREKDLVRGRAFIERDVRQD